MREAGSQLLGALSPGLGLRRPEHWSYLCFPVLLDLRCHFTFGAQLPHLQNMTLVLDQGLEGLLFSQHHQLE